MAPEVPLCKTHMSSVEVVELEQVPVGKNLWCALQLWFVSYPLVPSYQVGPNGEEGFMEQEVVKTKHSCKIAASWPTEWLPPNTQYELRYRKRGQGAWKLMPTKNTSRVITDLPTSTEYEVGVRAKNSEGWGPVSEITFITTPDPEHFEKRTLK